MGEIDIYGIYVPSLLVYAVMSYLLLQLILKGIQRLKLTEWIMLPNLFHLGLYVIVFGVVHWVFVA